MRLLIVAVGTRMPDWVKAGVQDYVRRMPRELPVELLEIKPARRGMQPADEARRIEAARIEAALPANAHVVLLDERGSDCTTIMLARRLAAWRDAGREVAFVIGGPDGVAEVIRTRAREVLRLSSLTLPHALVRVVLAEALYRALSVLQGHPYHRGDMDT